MKIVLYTRLIAECNQQYNLYIQHTVKHAMVKYLNSHGCHRWRCRHHSATIKSIAFLTGKPKPFSSALLPPPIILISLIICTCIPLRLKWNCDHSLDVRHRSRFTYESSRAREKKSTQSERERELGIEKSKYTSPLISNVCLITCHKMWDKIEIKKIR